MSVFAEQLPSVEHCKQDGRKAAEELCLSGAPRAMSAERLALPDSAFV